MKRFSLSLLFLLIINSINAQNYVSLSSSQKGWCYENIAGLGTVPLSVKSVGDTTINSKKYTTYQDKNMLLRDDIQTKKVFRFNTTTQTETLLYDFNLTLGDTITINFKDFRPVLMTVSLVDSIVTNLDTLTVIHFNHNDTSLALGSKLENNFKWIEGVGSNWHPNYINNYKTLSNLGVFGYNVVCAYVNGRRFFINDTSYCHIYSNITSCSGLNNLTKIKTNSILTYPSPFTKYFTVDAENIEAITLYDMLGRTVYHSETKTTNPVLVFFERELDAGYYQLKVKTKLGMLTQKVMKQ